MIASKNINSKGPWVIDLPNGDKFSIHYDIIDFIAHFKLPALATAFESDEVDILADIKQIFLDGELHESGNVKIRGTITYYHLDLFIALALRVKSTKGTNFRAWMIPEIRKHVFS